MRITITRTIDCDLTDNHIRVLREIRSFGKTGTSNGYHKVFRLLREIGFVKKRDDKEWSWIVITEDGLEALRQVAIYNRSQGILRKKLLDSKEKPTQHRPAK